MKMSKKKVFVTALALCLVAILSLGTLAWFNAADEITNRFMVADSDNDNVPDFSVEVWENENDGDDTADQDGDGSTTITHGGNEYPEIENKETRPYLVILFRIDNLNFALPFRTNITHKYGYRFKNSSRPKDSVSGIDFTKAVVIDEDKYIAEQTTIDNKEYIELDKNYYYIISKFEEYLHGYLEYINNPSSDAVSKKYKYTSLKYFHKQLHISD